MSLRRFVWMVTALLLLEGPGAVAGKIPMNPERLQAESPLIVTGKVESVDRRERGGSDGSRTALLTLKVAVDAVDKGNARPGDTIKVTCWRVVKRPSDGILWDTGNGYVPAVGGRARFFLLKEHEGAWETQWPNGIEAIDGAPAMGLPMEDPDPVPATTPSAVVAASSPWPYLIGAACATMAVLAVVIYLVARRGRG
jgi:hypothetical protein